MKSIRNYLCLSITIAAILLTFAPASAAPKKNKAESKAQQKITKKTATKPLSKKKEPIANQKTGTSGLTQPITSQKTPTLSNQKNMPQIPGRKPVATQPAIAKQTASPNPALKSSSLLSKSVPFTKKSMNISPEITAAQEFINIMVLYSKRSELENDLFSNNPSNKTIAFLGLELHKAYPLISLDDAVNMIHDTIAEQIFNKRTSSEFMNFVRNAIKNYWSKQSPMLNFYQGTNLTQEEQENLSSPL